MDLEYYRNFVAIVETGSLTAAAERQCIAQPALSNQIKTLEREYNAKLLVISRGIRKLELTDAGRIFYEKARHLSDMEDQARKEVTACTQGITGTLRISLSPSRTTQFVRKYVKPFSRKYPAISYNLWESNVLTQVEQVQNGFVELAFANATIPDIQRFDILAERKERIVIIAHRDNPWITTSEQLIDASMLKNVPISISKGHHGFFSRLCNEAGFEPNILALTGTKATALEFAQNNISLAAVPMSQHEHLDDCLKKYVIESNLLLMSKSIFKAKGRELSAPMARFFEFYQDRYGKPCSEE